MHLKKPSWLKAKTWGEFCSKYQREDGSFPCSHPGCLRFADTVDHIKPRSHPDFTELREYIDEDDRRRKQSNPDAAHVLENLQPMCRSHNSSKGVRPDAYWSSNLYFDRSLDLDKLRASQRDYIYTAMREAGPLMVGRLNQINGKLLSFFQVTGAGKTLGKFVLPFAINHGLIDASDMHRPARVDPAERGKLGGRPKEPTRDHEQVSVSPVDPRLYVEELASDDFNDGYNAAPKNGNGEDRRTRFRRIMRDSPDVADRFLAGEFIRRYKNGRSPEEDLVAAEVAAGIRKEGEKVQRRNGLAYAMKLIGTFNTKQLTELQVFINQLMASGNGSN